MGIKKATEKTFMAAVRKYAQLKGWTVIHHQVSKGTEAGFPDLLFVRAKGHVRAVFAELKLDGKDPTPEQTAVLAALRHELTYVYVWRPADWKLIELVLGGES